MSGPKIGDLVNGRDMRDSAPSSPRLCARCGHKEESHLRMKRLDGSFRIKGLCKEAQPHATGPFDVALENGWYACVCPAFLALAPKVSHD